MKILPPTVFFTVAALMALAHFVVPGPTLLPGSARLLGVPVFAAGAWINWAGAMRFHRSGTDIRAIVAPTRLITDGLYARSRNPIYLGFLAMLLGAAIGLGETVPLVLTAAFAVVIERAYIRREEAAMARIFGADYEAYRARVRRWL
ncbi:MAG: isoprenylcysteine carboxylmethyltransferase family protein [Phyllobacteriaceae bacterium]|nr:isoprenylcysteine carboxylmethyltransferase family protein [Phyllobacteriaceae bacterium]